MGSYFKLIFGSYFKGGSFLSPLAVRGLALVLLLSAFPLASGDLKPQQEADFWKNSGMDSALVALVINEKDCYSKERNRAACWRAIKAGAEMVGLAMELNESLPLSTVFEKITQAKTDLPREMVWGKILNTYLKQFDRYARVVPRYYTSRLYDGEDKVYYGPGMEVVATGAGAYVVQVDPNTPASLADFKVHDRLLSVNGKKAFDLRSARKLVAALEGTPNQTLNIEVERHGRFLETKTITIAAITFEQIDKKLITVGARSYLHVHLHSFSAKTCFELDNIISTQQEKSNFDGLILDLRRNAGGYLRVAECVARLFVGEKTIVKRKQLVLDFPAALDFAHAPDGPEVKLDGSPGPYADLPLVVLIDAGSASASEVTAGALQDYARAWIVGERSFGKGLTQSFHDLVGYPKLQLIRTENIYLRPLGLAVQERGITPNFETPFRPGATVRERQFWREENDPHSVKTEAEDPEWSETRKEKSVINECLKAKEGKTEDGADGQLAKALAIFSCEASEE